MVEEKSKFVNDYEIFWNLFTTNYKYIKIQEYVTICTDADNLVEAADGTLIVMNNVEKELTNEYGSKIANNALLIPKII